MIPRETPIPSGTPWPLWAGPMRYSSNVGEHAHLYACSDLVLLIRPGDTVDYGGVMGARTANNGVPRVCVRDAT
jgi:hypothetical protein